MWLFFIKWFMVNSNQIKKNQFTFLVKLQRFSVALWTKSAFYFCTQQLSWCLFFMCAPYIYLVDNILPVLDEGESAPTAVCVLSEGEGSCSSPQIQLPQSFSDRHLRLSTTVQILYQCAPHAHTKNTRLCISHIGFCVWTARLPHYISSTSLKSANMSKLFPKNLQD